MSEPLVSVLIPIYNHAHYIRQCLDSVLNEGWCNLEVLMIDDGSNDDSFEVAEQWHNQHPNAFTRVELLKQENQGLTKTLNRLIKLATGDYVILLASDDMLISGGIQARVEALEKHPKWLAVFGDCTVIDSDGKQIYSSGITQLWDRPARKEALLEEKLLPYEITLHWTIPGPVLMLKRNTFDRVGYYDESLIVEDRDFYLRLALQGYLGFIDVLVARYRFHPSNSYNNEKRLVNALRAMSVSLLKNVNSAEGYLKLVIFVDGYRQNAYSRKLTTVGLTLFLWRIYGFGLKIIWEFLDIGYELYRIWIQKMNTRQTQ
jgi:glycosyltransferase involved in cell wall biosynthesis